MFTIMTIIIMLFIHLFFHLLYIYLFIFCIVFVTVISVTLCIVKAYVKFYSFLICRIKLKKRPGTTANLMLSLPPSTLSSTVSFNVPSLCQSH